jgi:hypothetical protein
LENKKVKISKTSLKKTRRVLPKPRRARAKARKKGKVRIESMWNQQKFRNLYR